MTKCRIIIAVALLASLATTPAWAQEEEDTLTPKSDQTGTNPINFTFDARAYNEYSWLNVPGEAARNVTTFEFRAPFASGKWQVRARMRATHLDIDQAGVDEFGFGDMDVRFLTVPYMNIPAKFAIAAGAEFFIPTGSDDVLSRNAFSIGPQVFFGFFVPFGGLFDLIAPGYQHQFSVSTESGAPDIHQGNIDVFFLKSFNNRQQWMLLNPQAVIDYENNREAVLIDTEFGTMLFGGHSAYIRPSVGIGNDRPHDFAFELGYKIIW